MRSKATWSIAVHGGAGALPGNADEAYIARKLSGLEIALRTGAKILEAGGQALDAVQKVVQAFEDDPCFNAGRGSVLDYQGNVSMDASIMDGSDLSCGAVANIVQVRNPVMLARYVRDHTPHVLLAGAPADALAVQVGLEIKSREYFLTEEQVLKWQAWRKRQDAKKPKSDSSLIDERKKGSEDTPPEDEGLFRLSTVGCVARDLVGDLAAATSTGGLVGKQYGRVGDSPIIGAGTYAKNGVCAISCTGIGELFIKHQVAGAIAQRMQLRGESLSEAMRNLLREELPKDSGGAIGVDAQGAVELVFNTPVMARGFANASGEFSVSIV